VIVTVLFIFIHTGNPEFGDDTLKGFLTYLGLSALFGLATVLDDGIEVAVGLHAANNMVLAVIISPVGGSFTTYSLFTSELALMLAASPWLDLVMAAVTMVVLTAIFRWRFSRLSEPISGGRVEAAQPQK
jgi:hypothetical protein